MSAYFKFKGGEEITKGFAEFEWPLKLAFTLGVIEIVYTILYAIPQTAVLGAILLTGYLGGATATHVRIEDPVWFPPVIMGVQIWLGLLHRGRRLWVLLPFRKL